MSFADLVKEFHPLGEVGTRHGLKSGLDGVPIGHVGAEMFPGGPADYYHGSGYMLVPDHPAFRLLPNVPLMVSCWFLLETLPDGSQYPTLIAKYGNQQEYALYINSGRLHWVLQNGATVLASVSSDPDSLVVGKLHHALAWYDPETNEAGLALDNSIPVTATLSGQPAPGGTAAPLTYGAKGDGSMQLTGYLLSVAWFNTILSLDEKNNLYNGGQPLPYASY